MALTMARKRRGCDGVTVTFDLNSNGEAEQGEGKGVPEMRNNMGENMKYASMHIQINELPQKEEELEIGQKWTALK